MRQSIISTRRIVPSIPPSADPRHAQPLSRRASTLWPAIYIRGVECGQVNSVQVSCVYGTSMGEGVGCEWAMMWGIGEGMGYEWDMGAGVRYGWVMVWGLVKVQVESGLGYGCVWVQVWPCRAHIGNLMNITILDIERYWPENIRISLFENFPMNAITNKILCS